jgi:hypothetical protein
LARILDFVSGMVEVVEEETARLRAQQARRPEKGHADSTEEP